ncbi:NAD(P)-binding domain-containing protein [Myxococcota bacterium]|nr:NAD(P)-binding domain-containing protein [Myxococcota bacterium]
MTLYELLAWLLLPLLGLLLTLEARLRLRARRARLRWIKSERAGLNEPPTLHPHIDVDRCIGAGACITACPEKDVLGLVAGRGALIKASACVGHGVCEAACPVSAIRLVFGTERQGLAIPRVLEAGATEVAGLSMAGEIGGVGLIHNAARQGMEAARRICAEMQGAGRLVIVGAGPAGVAAALQARALGVEPLILEQAAPLNTIRGYARGKPVFTQPFTLPHGEGITAPRVRREDILDLFEAAAATLSIQRGRLVGLARRAAGFELRLEGGATLEASQVLIAIGRRGAPRRLGVPGEAAAHVLYQLEDAAAYAGRAVLVVGGGNSAAEVAVMLAATPGCRVILSYRGAAFNRVAEETRAALAVAEAEGRLRVWLESQVRQIEPGRALVAPRVGEAAWVEAEAVLVQIGGIVPTELLLSMGITVELHHGLRVTPLADASGAP